MRVMIYSIVAVMRYDYVNHCSRSLFCSKVTALLCPTNYASASFEASDVI